MSSDLEIRKKFEELRHEMNLLSQTHSLSAPEILQKSMELDEIHNLMNQKAYKKTDCANNRSGRETSDPTPLQYTTYKGSSK